MRLLGSLSICMLLVLLASCGEKPRKAWFFTQGNCPECEAIIVAALEQQPGVDSVGWDFEMGLTVAKVDPSKNSPDRLQRVLAAKGFTTQYYPGDTTAAKALPACCTEVVARKLKRKEIAIPSH